MKTRITALIALITCLAWSSLVSAEVLRGHATAAAPSYPEAQDKPFSLDLNGNLRVTTSTGTGTSAAQVQGTAASDAPVVGNPLQNGGRASSTTPTAVSGSGDAVASWMTLEGATMIGAFNATAADATANTYAQLPTNGSTNRALQVYPSFYNGTTWDRLRGDATGGLIAQGPAAQGATAVGNPIRDGGVYTSNANQPAVTTGQITSLQTDPAGNLRTAPQRPTAGDILVGYATVTATTASTVLATITAGRTWVGQLCASVDGNKAATATGNGLVNATFLTVGTNVVPAAGTYFGVGTSAGANAATGTVGTQGSNQGCTPWTQVSPVGNTTTINYAATCTNTTACNVHVSAVGVMQ